MDSDRVAMALGLGLLCGGLYLSWRGFSFLGDALTRNVAYVTGRIIPQTVTSKGATTYYMVVGPVRTRISRKTYNTMPTGLNCHAYYASGSLHLLSLEPATETEPHPSLRFGGDAAHAWDRLRWRMVIAAVSAFGVAAGVHAIATSHPAQTFMVSGTISAYEETTGKGAYRHVFLVGSSQEYSLDRLGSYSPRIPELGSYLGDPVDLYINADTNDAVLALRLRETVYAADYYLHPEHQKDDTIAAGATVALVSGVLLAVALWWQQLVRAKRAVVPSYMPLK